MATLFRCRFFFRERAPVMIVLLLSVFTLACQLVISASDSVAIGRLPARAVVENSSVLPVGTILPIRLENTISVAEAKRGQAISAKIAQTVPLPNRENIPLKSDVSGSITSVELDSEGSGVRVTMKFNQVDARKQTLKFTAYLRAIASYNAVRSAQIPLTGADGGTPNGWGNTLQIGGDIRYGDGGMVRSRSKQKVGKGVFGGVLVRVQANPALGCDGAVNGDDRPQALWVFSSDACGAYDLRGVQVSHTGKGAPVGEFTLHFDRGDMKLEAGTAMLLRVISPDSASQ